MCKFIVFNEDYFTFDRVVCTSFGISNTFMLIENIIHLSMNFIPQLDPKGMFFNLDPRSAVRKHDHKPLFYHISGMHLH